MTSNKNFILFVFFVMLAVLIAACNAAEGAASAQAVSAASGEAVNAASAEEVSTTGSQATALSQGELEAMLIATEKKKWDFSGEENFLTMADTFADDFINIGWSPTGTTRLNKEEAFAALAEVPPPLEGPLPVVSDFLVVHPHEGSAIVTYKVTAPWATTYATSVYAERDGMWQTVFYQDTDAAVAPSDAAVEQPEPAVDLPESDILITYADGKCSMEAATPLPSGELAVTLNVLDRDRAGYSAAFVTLEPGKTTEDLLAASRKTNAEKPEWVNHVSLQDALPGQVKSYSITAESGPLYLLCFSWNQDRNLIGYEGPIEVNG